MTGVPAHDPVELDADIAVIGAGAAGLMAAIQSARSGGNLRVVALDGSPRIGIKILVAGGGRCNVTHHAVSERDYAGSTPGGIRRVLSRFTVSDCVEFFRQLGVELKREETGKLFPTTDDARTVLDALLNSARRDGVDLRWPTRVERVRPLPRGGFEISGAWGTVRARALALCTGGKSLPKSGSDGFGLELARSLGHTVTDHLIPSLVPLVCEAGHWARSLSGLSLQAEVRVVSGTGKHLASSVNSMLFTHFGLSGPAALDISRHLLMERRRDPAANLQVCFLPDPIDGDADPVQSVRSPSQADAWLLQAKGQSILSLVRQRLPERLSRTLLVSLGIPTDTSVKQIDRDRRKLLAQLLCAAPMDIVGDRGFAHAEATAGGVPLGELNLSTMQSKVCPGLYLAGEMLDVDGRIGGFNFQWAWASGFVAGTSMAKALNS